ncbi:Olfactory receptor 7A17 [Myotis davidii]|uniref:Olfactory receptor n=1 Tax=Myotis davidii TaxID=225400 RepID=L5MCC5_MYODS|nr:Olfactory receptor 7A17 [Myotis davidii]
MELGNLTGFSEFLLLGLSEEPELQPLIFGLFLSMYLITVLGNLLIVLAVSSDSHLHMPMYFFLTNLSLVDICFTSTTVPKMLWNIQTQKKVITYAGCITQMYFFLLFAGLDNFLLTVMAYDRFVAICHPLHYTVIMNPQLCKLRPGAQNLYTRRGGSLSPNCTFSHVHGAGLSRQSDILSADVEVGEVPITAAALASHEPSFWLSSAPPVGAY